MVIEGVFQMLAMNRVASMIGGGSGVVNTVGDRRLEEPKFLENK